MAESRSSPKEDSSAVHGFSKSHNKTLGILDISKAYKFLTSKLYSSDHKSPNSSKSQAKAGHSPKESTRKKNAERIARSDDATTSPGGGASSPHDNADDSSFLRRRPSFLSKSSSKRIDTTESSSSSSFLSRSTSRRSKTPTFSSFTRSSSRSRARSKSTTRRSSSIMEGELNSLRFDGPLLSRNMSGAGAGSEPVTPNKLSRSMSGNRGSTPIVFSQSAARRKPLLPMEKKLECTLEELLSGCAKKVVMTRDVLSEFGTIEQEEETLKINVKPGWRKGTKITFEGKGDEKPGYLPADLVFVVDEVRHPLFKRKEDDLEIAVEIPLVQALTGGTLYVPLLGGEKMGVLIDEIVYPGYEKVIPGQGMPCFQEEDKRGDLRITFSVVFPKELTQHQRLEICSALLEDDESSL